ncbi:MAG: hypothetical protein QOF73_4346 [Thermomicrobiales bacterium]|nr:hypothetical protein [Thermomicrobiales bacterium]
MGADRPADAPRVRAIANMAWAATGCPGSGDLIEYEARANYVLPEYRDPVICVYRAAEVGGDVVLDILRTHPMAVVSRMLYENPFFVPPAMFLADLTERRQPAG